MSRTVYKVVFEYRIAKRNSDIAGQVRFVRIDLRDDLIEQRCGSCLSV